MELLIGTNNHGKIIEIKQALDGLPVSVLMPADLKIQTAPLETADTFAENALIKARYYHRQTKLPTLADDSGIIVEALKDELGVHTRRWGPGSKASDKEWIEFFLNRMKHETNKNARFICSLSYIDSAGVVYGFEGICEGIITPALEADYLSGLPISACFKPKGYDLVYSAMNIEQKNSTSHRGRAVKKFRDFLSEKLR